MSSRLASLRAHLPEVSETTAARAMAAAVLLVGLSLMVYAIAMVWLPAAVFLAGAGLTVFGVLALVGLRVLARPFRRAE